MRTNLGAAVYGAITVGALLAAESARRENYGETVGAVALAMVLYWLAHGYTEHVSIRGREESRLDAKELADAMVHELPVLVGAAVPLVTVLIAWAAGASLDTAIGAAVWTAVAAIVTIELVVGVQAKLKGGELVLQAAIGAGLGLLVLTLRLVLH
jgi:hypothetical protein